jgi:lysozyme
MNIGRTPIAALALSAAGLIGLVMSEGYSDKAIIPVPGDVPTIGFGSTRNVRMGDTTNPVAALARAGKEINQEYEATLKRCVTVPLYQYEYDVYVDHAYNVGTNAFCSSTIVKRLNQQDYAGACDAILMWKKHKGLDCSLPVNSKICGGLWTRRLEVRSKCLGGAND